MWTILLVVVVVVGLVAVVGIVAGSRNSGQRPAAEHATRPRVARPPLTRRLTLRAQQGRAVARLAAVGRPVYCGARRGRELALTFDDGPGP